MKDCLKITKIIKKNNRIDYVYTPEGKWKELLNLKEQMFIEYDTNIEQVPDSIAIVPLLCNILPISWLFDITISIDVIDKEFYDCIPDVKKGYCEMYPHVSMLGNLEIEKIENNYYDSEKSSSLFSGGLDAFDTLFEHMQEKPDLLTVWGADITLKDEIGWNKVKKHHLSVGKQYELSNSFIKSNFRTSLNYNALSAYVSKKIGGEWWHEFQHGIGILGLVAPLAYINHYSTIYIASTYTPEYKGQYTCASDPIIDNHLRFASCKVVHDGYEKSRQDKIRNICKHLEQNNENFINLRVCWKSTGGNNCCECEKCYRTILGILVEKKDPNNFGFNFTEEKRIKMMQLLPKYAKYQKKEFYECIQRRFLENFSTETTPKDLIWFRKFKLKGKKPKLVIAYEKGMLFLKHHTKILKK